MKKQKQVKNRDKQPKDQREVRFGSPTNAGKQARYPFSDEGGNKPRWSFAILDVGSQWCWSAMAGGVLVQALERLGNFEGMTWTEIEQGTGSHFVAKDDIIRDAQKRLIDIEQDDADVLFSLRIDGPHRLWGIRENDVLKFLWSDPNHEICPSPKR